MRYSRLTSQSFGGSWTQDKLEILRRYLDAYTTVLKNQPFTLIYIDAFAGPGNWQPGSTYSSDDYFEFNEMLIGSPNIALEVDDKPFDNLVFIEQNPKHLPSLGLLSSANPHRNIAIIDDDANVALPKICGGLDHLERAVVFLDPFATEVSWTTIESIARTRKVDCWILFPLMAITRLMPVDREPDEEWAVKLDRVFGGRQYWKGFYAPASQQTFWSQGTIQQRERGSSQIAERYRNRLNTVFDRGAPTRRVLKNSQNSALFDLFFAASNPNGAPVATRIADHILKNW